MSDALHDIVAVLSGTEFYVRAQAALLLHFPTVLDVERKSSNRARMILESIGLEDLGTFDEGTDELLRAASDDKLFQPLYREGPVAVPLGDDPDAFDTVVDTSISNAAAGAAALAGLGGAAAAVGAGAAGRTIPEAEELFPPGFDDGFEDPPAPLEVHQPLTPLADEVPEDTFDPAAFGDRDETEDLLADENRHSVDALLEIEELHDPIVEAAVTPIDVDDPGEDALVTIETSSDPRSDLEGLSRLDDHDSDLDDDDDSVGDDGLIVRKDDAPDPIESLDLLPESDLHPDDEETFVADLADIEKMKAKMDGDDEIEIEEIEPEFEFDEQEDHPTAIMPAPGLSAEPRPVKPRVGVAGVAAAAAVPGAAAVTAGLYGNPSVPTIRDRNAPKPRAAAIQIDEAQDQAAKGMSTGNVLEEEELLELGSSEDYGEEEVEGDTFGDGLSVDVHEYEEEVEEVEEIEEIEELDDVDLQALDDVDLEPLDEEATPEEIRALLANAEKAKNEGEMEDAIDFYSDVIDSDPDNVGALVSRGRLYLDYSDYSRAMSDFMIAEELAPDNPEPQIAVGDLYFARKDYNRAIECFNEALKKAPDHAMAFCRRGISHYYRKHYPQALEDLNRAQKLDGDIPNIRTYVAMARKKAKR